MSWCDHRWMLGATILTAGHGGIARVARLTARAMLEAGADLDMLALADETAVEIAGRRALTTRGSRWRYGLRCHLGAAGHDRFLYDAVGPARAHPRLPGLRRPYGIWVHGIEVWYGLSPARKRALDGARFCVVNSQFTLSRYESLHGPLANAHVCHLATEADTPPPAAPSRGETARPPTALLIGRPDGESFHKGHREVVQCWHEVVAKLPQARLLLAGGGTGLELLRALVAQSPARDQIEVLGFVPEDDMEALWARSNVFVLPSRQEGFGLVYIEAMRQGLPVIASVHDAGQEVNLDGVTGFNVDLDDPGALPARLVELLEAPDKARAMGAAGRDRWHAQFRYSAFRDRLLAILDAVDAP